MLRACSHYSGHASKADNSSKELFVLDLDSYVAREVEVHPTNEPEHEVMASVADVLKQKPGLLPPDIDRGYRASPRLAQWADRACTSLPTLERQYQLCYQRRFAFDLQEVN